jgi:hypothetical protein
MALLVRRPVDDVDLGGERRQHRGNFAHGMLQVIVHRDDDVVLRRSYAAKQGIVLTIVSAHAQPAHAMVRAGQIYNDRPRTIAATILDKMVSNSEPISSNAVVSYR